MNATFVTVVEAFARLYPWPVETNDELRDALAFLGWDLAPEGVVRAGYGGGFVVATLSVLTLPFAPRGLWVVVAPVGCVLAVAVAHLVHSLPALVATARRTRALGAAPDLVTRAVLSMRLTPTPERAAAFAARTGEGPLASSLEDHVRRTQHTGRSALETFGDEWGEWFPSLRRSFALVAVAGRSPAADRDRLLERALSVVLEGTSDQLRAFAARIRAPVTAVYAFGVLLPTALVALLPAAGAAGIAVTPATVVVLYNVCLPALLAGVAVRLLVRRPVAFPPPAVTRSHPDVRDTRPAALVVGLAVALAAWLAASRLFPAWAPPIAAVGLGPGVALVVATRPVVAVYGRVRDVEAGLADVLELVGRRVANGRAVEAALADVADELDGTMGDVLAAGARQQRQLHVGVREAFLGRRGVLRTVPSARVWGSFALLSLAAREGRPAGAALLALSEHVEDLRRIERDARRRLAHICGTLANTAALFGPMVAGTTVALADGVGGEAFFDGAFGWLGGPVGAYVLLLAVTLTALSVGLVRGFDRALVGYRVGRALACATLVYLGSYLLAGAVL